MQCDQEWSDTRHNVSKLRSSVIYQEIFRLNDFDTVDIWATVNVFWTVDALRRVKARQNLATNIVFSDF